VLSLRRFVSWLLVAMWMTSIFVGSTDVLSSRNTSRFIGPFLRWVYPKITTEQIRTVQFYVRKCGHLSEYAIMSALVWNALMQTMPPNEGRMRRSLILALLICCLYAASDEFHQSFVPTREASIIDVVIDTCGAGIGLSIIWLLGRLRKRMVNG
jgi:VanZ family protein